MITWNRFHFIVFLSFRFVCFVYWLISSWLDFVSASNILLHFQFYNLWTSYAFQITIKILSAQFFSTIKNIKTFLSWDQFIFQTAFLSFLCSCDLPFSTDNRRILLCLWLIPQSLEHHFDLCTSLCYCITEYST